MVRFEPDGTGTLVAQSDTPWNPPPLGTASHWRAKTYHRGVSNGGRPPASTTGRRPRASRRDGACRGHSFGRRHSGCRRRAAMGQADRRHESERASSARDRLADRGFTELVATAIANAGERDELAASEARARDLAAEQAGLRRVATLVAKGASSTNCSPPSPGRLRRPRCTCRGPAALRDDGMFTMVAIAGETTFTVGSRWPVEDEGLAGMILATGRPARKQDYTTMPGPLDAALETAGSSRRSASRSSSKAPSGGL